MFLIFCLVSVFAYAGGGQEEAKPEKLIYMSAAWGAPSQELLDKFEADTGIKVEVTTLDVKPLRDKVMTAAAGKVNPADIIFVGIDDIGGFASSCPPPA
ncbi:MAG TPA: extracellular solute-binding protein [Spirochaetales bacterium]|nr:extracellular solute-binding protein [Spirochaetales bacterium]